MGDVGVGIAYCIRHSPAHRTLFPNAVSLADLVLHRGRMELGQPVDFFPNITLLALLYAGLLVRRRRHVTRDI